MKSPFLLILLLFCTAAQAQENMSAEAILKEMEEIRQSEQRIYGRLLTESPKGDAFTVASTNFDIHYLRLEWTLNPAIRYISGAVTNYFTITETTNSIVFDLLNSLRVDSIYYHNGKISFQQTPDNGVTVNFPAALSKNTKDSLTIFYQGDPGSGGFGSFYQGSHAGTPVVWTLSEPYGSREWWPCKNNLTDKVDSVDIIVTVPQAYQPSSNGVMVTNDVIGFNRVSYFRHRHPIVPYLIAIAATNYIVTTDTLAIGNDIIQLQNFAYPENNSYFNAWKGHHRSTFRTFTRLFGPYPFRDEKYGHTQWGWNGGMEHQTNSFVNFPTPTLQGHELAHQWFGDYVTCGSWQDIWLNEGFATYLTLLFIEDGYPNSFKNTQQGIYASALVDSAGSVFCPDTTSEARIFSSRMSYNKGAYVVQMLRFTLGDSVFARGLRRYLNDPKLKNGFAFTADLQRNLEAESGKDLDYYFEQWVYGQGYPNYAATWSQNKNNWITFKLNQSTTHPSVPFFKSPVPIRLKGVGQTKTVILDHTFSGQEFSIDAGFVVDSIFIDPDIWLLSKIKTVTKLAGESTNNDLRIYPNPTAGNLIVKLDNPTDKQLTIQLWNAVGQLVYTKVLATAGQNERIEIPSTVMARGVYLLSVRSEKSVKRVQKIIRQ